MAQQQSNYTPTYVTPIICECGGLAHLARRAPDPSGLGKAEVRTFECEKCDRIIELATES